MATTNAAPIREGAYLTNGRQLVQVVEVRPDGSAAVENVRTERIHVLRPPKLARWRPVTPSDG